MKLKLAKSALTAEIIRLYPGFFSLQKGLPCKFRQVEMEGYAVAFQEDKGPDGEIEIRYGGTDDLVLALGDMMSRETIAPARKKPPYKFRGLMLDVSRNAVVKVDFLKERIARLAMLGLNYFCLYTEDLFTVPGEPLFGYARGRYSDAEIKELVKYGKLFGVTLFPCIQTLGHMEHILKYPHYAPLRDNDMVYNVYAKDMYAFIEKTIDAARAAYDTDLIHIGMDETFGLGRGHAFKEGQPIHPRRMYVEHLGKVVEICRKKGLKPIMWGDIVLGTTGEEGVNKEEAALLPKDVIMDYWQYALDNVDKYAKDLGEFKAMGYTPMVSPGVWSWSRFFPAFHKAQSNISSLLEAGRRQGVTQALNTQWGDDGHECFFDFNLPGNAYFLAQCTEEKDFLAAAKKKFAAVFGADFDSLRSTEKIDLAKTKFEALIPHNVGKCFFYDDPAQGLFSGLPFVKPASDFYAKTAKEMGELASAKDIFQPLYRFAESFCDFLATKADLRRNVAAAYKKKDKKALKAQLKEIASATRKLQKVRKLYRAYWLTERKPFGLEIIEGRMGALGARLDYLGYIIGEHLAGRLAKLEELEFPHFSMFHESRSPDYQPSVWPEYYLHYSALASRNTIKWW